MNKHLSGTGQESCKKYDVNIISPELIFCEQNFDNITRWNGLVHYYIQG